MASFEQSEIHTLLCGVLGVRYPIIQAGMAGGITTPELVSAVSEAGALGPVEPYVLARGDACVRDINASLSARRILKNLFCSEIYI